MILFSFYFLGETGEGVIHIKWCGFAESLMKDALVKSVDGGKVQETGCSTSSNISNEHLTKVVADSATSSSQLQDNAENRVLEGDSSVSTEKHSISVQARL